MSLKKVIIVDDEKLARDLIVNYLSDEDNIEIIAQYNNGLDALKGIKEHQPDIVFLDVQMPKITGLELIELLEFTPQIIFTTAYDQFAVKAFELNAIDYLMKPFSKQRLLKALSKAIEKSNNSDFIKLKNTFTEFAKQNERIAVKKGNKIAIIPFEEILYITAQDDYIQIVTEQESFLKKQTLESIKQSLTDHFFVIHRSHIINMKFLKHIEKEGKENYFAIMKNGKPLKISRSNYPLLKQKLNL
ncbi:MAG TPA: DNA-binding response regulator [Flavobacteriales bacterium]|nr:DNA-binding response regulator [Flavobacteriales bacterium]|tara:strand:- start:38062 stop:38796 length:735 start_codon:yes stop_codon:yes gene_type:complete